MLVQQHERNKFSVLHPVTRGLCHFAIRWDSVYRPSHIAAVHLDWTAFLREARLTSFVSPRNGLHLAFVEAFSALVQRWIVHRRISKWVW